MSSITRVLVVVLAAAACGPPIGACEPLAGGDAGSEVQLRGVRFGDDDVSFLFGLRAGATFGIPRHSVEGGSGGLRVHIPGARLHNPDGSPSYHGERAIRPPGGRVVDVRIEESSGGGITIGIRAAGGGCPRLAARRYGLGTTHPAALISIALRDGPVVALDPDRGTPGFPMQVVGLGFAPSSPVSFHAGGRLLWSSRVGPDGALDTVLFVPALAPGDQRVLVRDAAGAATAWLRVDRSDRSATGACPDRRPNASVP